MSYEILYTRLANSQKITDRYLTVQFKESSDPLKSSMGKIFAVVEITTPWYPNSQIGQSIINILTREYYKLSPGDTSTNFESALKKVNENLARIVQEGEASWVGNLNCILALVTDKEIFLSQCGKAEAFLFRKGKINRITEGLAQELETNPLHIFANVMSGELNKNDKILLTSPAVLDYFSQKELQAIVSEGTTYQNIQNIAQFLRKEKARHINLVLLQPVSKTDLENLPLEQAEVIYLDQSGSLELLASSTKKYTSQLADLLDKMGENLNLGWEKINYFWRKEILPHSQFIWKETKELSRKGYDYFTTQTAPTIKTRLKPFSQKIKDKIKNISISRIKRKGREYPTTDIAKIEEVIKKQPYSVNYYEIEAEKKSILEMKIKSFSREAKLIFGRIFRKVRKILSWLFAKENRSIFYALVVVILIIVLIINIGQLRKRQNIKKQEQEQAQMLASIENEYEEAKLAILYNNQEKAKNLLNEVIKKANEIMNNQPKLADQAKEIITKANGEFDKLTMTTRFNNPTKVAEFPQISKIFILNDKIIGLDNTNNNLYYTDLEAKTKLTQAPGPEASAGIYQAFTFDSKENNIFCLTNKNQLYKISSADKTAEKIIPTQGTWESAIDLGSFLGNIYLLDQQNGQIWKHTETAQGFSSGLNYVDTAKVDLKNALSMTIDGAIFVLKSDNSVVKLVKGNPQDFNLRDIPTPNDKITKAKKIWTNSEINSLYILDDNRIIEVDKTGKFIRQYAFSPDLQNISDFFIQPKEKRIWILDRNKVYKVEY